MACEGVYYQRFKKRKKKINPWDTQTLPLKTGDEKTHRTYISPGEVKAQGNVSKLCNREKLLGIKNSKGAFYNE